MKRSEMIEILRESFIRHMNPPEPCCNNDEEMYSHILQDIENKGMMPPEIFRHCNCEDCGGEDRSFYWEEE